jgi:lactoylglutathione lyase
MLKLPGDEFVALELVHDPSAADTSAPGFSHFAVHVESLEATVARLTAAGIRSNGIESPAPDLHTTTVTDPDGRTIELVQWPPGHPEGMTAADWPDGEEHAP